MEIYVRDKIEDDFDSEIIRISRKLKNLNVKEYATFKNLDIIEVFDKYLTNERQFQPENKNLDVLNLIILDKSKPNALLNQNIGSETDMLQEFNFLVTFMFVFFTIVFFGLYYLLKYTYFAFKSKNLKKREIRLL